MQQPLRHRFFSDFPSTCDCNTTQIKAVNIVNKMKGTMEGCGFGSMKLI